MQTIFSWGYEAPVKQDYTKNNAHFSNKIQKLGRTFTTEAKDNFRKPAKIGDQLIFNYFDEEEKLLTKKKLIKDHEEKENRRATSYQDLHQRPCREAVYNENVVQVPAGKPNYNKKRLLSAIEQKVDKMLKKYNLTVPQSVAEPDQVDFSESDRGDADPVTVVELKKQETQRKEMMSKAEQENIRQQVKYLKEQGRLLSDSALTTYFGKPAFHNYGSHNVAPSSGGLVYGEYMKTHNVNPHSGPNKPACQ